jgi:hypothetical protein
MFDESLFASGFDLDRISRRTTYTQQELNEHNLFSGKYNAEEMSNQTKNNASSLLKKQIHTVNSDRDDLSSNFNIPLMHANNGEDYNNISGVLNDVNTSLLSYQNNTKRNNNENLNNCKEEEGLEIHKPRKPGINQMAIDLSKNDGKNMELLNHNVKSPVLNMTSSNERINSSKNVNLKSGEKKIETNTEKFFFSFEKDAQVNDNRSKNNTKKFSMKETSTEANTERKNQSEFIIGNPIITVTKKIPKTFNKKDINLIEEILNTQNEFQTNEDIEINHTSFNNNITYVRSFPFSNSNQYNSMILFNSGNENENEKTSPNNKTTTAFSKASDLPFLENQMQKEYYRMRENAKMREIIQSFSDEELKILQIEDTKEYSKGPCDGCAKQCLIF